MRRFTFLIATALVALAAAPTAFASDAKRPAPWTKAVDVNLSARQLALPAAASPQRLARAAIEREAGLLGLDDSATGLRLARSLRTPSAHGARPLRQLRFQQTAGGLRVAWSQIDVTVVRGRVRAIDATVVHVKRGFAARAPGVSRQRALRIARRAVVGPEDALQPQPVAYAGKPSANRAAKRRSARRAWLVELQPGGTPRDESAGDLCILVDAQTGKVIAQWPGMADRPAERPAATTSAAVTARTMVWIGNASHGPEPLGGVTRYAEFRLAGDPRTARWPAWNTGFAVPASQRSAKLDALTANALNVARTVCVVRGFCHIIRHPQFWQVFGNDPDPDLDSQAGRADRFHAYVTIADGSIMYGSGDPNQPFNDVVAHELGHLMDFNYASDRTWDDRNLEGRGVEEALADMFAYDYDRGDATFAEEATGGPYRSWANPGALKRDGKPYPSHMSGYDSHGDPHFNATILGHAYYLFVQRVGHAKAGAVLHTVPQRLSPRPTFAQVARSFTQSAHFLYGGSIAAEAIEAFSAVGLAPPPHDEPDCGPNPC